MKAARRSPSPKRPKKCAGEFVQALQDAVQLRRAELLHAAEHAEVAAQILEAVVADRDAEVLAGDVLDLVRFVEDHGVVVGEDAALVVLVLAARDRRRTGGD